MLHRLHQPISSHEFAKNILKHIFRVTIAHHAPADEVLQLVPLAADDFRDLLVLIDCHAHCIGKFRGRLQFGLVAHSVRGNSSSTRSPPPCALEALTLPPCIRTIRSVIASPRPAPDASAPSTPGTR